MNTAGWGNDLNRVVLAVPGDITVPHNAGCNRLIAQSESIILTRTSGIGEFCHAPHEPQALYEATSETTSFSTGCARTGGICADSDASKSAEHVITPSQQALLAAIGKTAPETSGQKPMDGIGQVMTDIGTLEARGLLRYDGAATLI